MVLQRNHRRSSWRRRADYASRSLAGLVGVGLLIYPWLSIFSGAGDRRYIQDIESRWPADWPATLSLEAGLDPKTYQQIGQALGDRLPWRGQVIAADVWSKRALGWTRFATVDWGKGNELFYRTSYGLADLPDGDRFSPERVDRLLQRIDRFLARQRHAHAQIRLVVVPNKESIDAENLTAAARADLAQVAPAQQRLRQGLAQRQDPRLLDLWSHYRQAKATHTERLYFLQDTHHTRGGSMVLAKALINSLRPGLWDDRQVFRESTLVERSSDLWRMLGLDRPEQLPPEPIFRLRRPGVEPVLFRWGDRTYPSWAAAKAAGMGELGSKRTYFEHRSQGEPLLPGRALVVRDSFIGPLQPNLAKFFTAVEYVHVDAISQAELERSLATYDWVIVQSVERNIFKHWERLLGP